MAEQEVVYSAIPMRMALWGSMKRAPKSVAAAAGQHRRPPEKAECVVIYHSAAIRAEIAEGATPSPLSRCGLRRTMGAADRVRQTSRRAAYAFASPPSKRGRVSA